MEVFDDGRRPGGAITLTRQYRSIDSPSLLWMRRIGGIVKIEDFFVECAFRYDAVDL